MLGTKKEGELKGKIKCPHCDGEGVIDISHDIYWYLREYEDEDPPEPEMDICYYCRETVYESS